MFSPRPSFPVSRFLCFGPSAALLTSFLSVALPGCSGTSTTEDGTGGTAAGTGGDSGTGGARSSGGGANSSGGAAQGAGGALAPSGGGPGIGGSAPAGGTTGSGGAGGNDGAGGSGPSVGGAPGSGGSESGSGGGGSGGGETCALPSRFAWSSTGPLAEPKNANARSLKDFSVTRHDDHYIVYATTNNGDWNGYFSQFDDFSKMKDAEQSYIPGLVAPQIFYFAPKNTWVLAYQWGFKYATSTNPSNPSSWSATKSLLSGDPTVGGPAGTGPIDLTVICDDSDCYLFFAGDNGCIYRGSMPIGNFPGTFTNAKEIMRDEKMKLFEAVEVYKIKGQEKYLMIVEAGDGGPRYFRAFTADSLGGTWTAMPEASTRATPFAGLNNVTFEGSKWSDDISHGDIVREDPSEKKEIDLCNLQFLYQGRNPSVGGDYGALPYRPGLLTLKK